MCFRFHGKVQEEMKNTTLTMKVLVNCYSLFLFIECTKNKEFDMQNIHFAFND